MKKLSYFFYGLSIVIICSCQKNKLDKDPLETLSKPTQLALLGHSVEEVKQGYALLNFEEKQALWETKWNTILEYDAAKMTIEQQKIVSSIRDFSLRITVKGFYDNPKIGKDFLEKNLTYFQKYFSQRQLFLLLEYPYFCKKFSIFNADEYLPEISARQNGNCTCYYSVSCYLDDWTVCVDGECDRVTGCGLLGSSNCSGKCR